MDLPLAEIDLTGDELIPLVAITGGLIFGAIWSVMWCIVTAVRAREAEKTRREIAAYISEGTISPEAGERLMKIAGTTPVSEA